MVNAIRRSLSRAADLVVEAAILAVCAFGAARFWIDAADAWARGLALCGLN